MVKQEWVDWARDKIRTLKDGSHIIFPDAQIVFRIDKVKKTLTVLCADPDWVGSDTEKINAEVFARCGYTVVTPESSIRRAVNTKGAMNPVTFQGPPVNGPNFTLGRLWLGTDSVREGPHKFTGAKGRRWEKSMQFVLWTDPLTPMTSGYLENEEHFIQAVRKLGDVPVRLVGQETRTSGDDRVLVLSRKDDRVQVDIRDAKGVFLGSTNIDSKYFMMGLGYLFPNGELR